MDPLTAFGLAANVLAFVELSFKAVGALREIKNNGSTKGNKVIDNLTRDLQGVMTDLKSPQPGVSPLPEGLLSLVSDFSALSEKLLGMLAKARTSGRTGGGATFKALWHSFAQNSEIDSMQQALDRYRSQIALHIGTMTRTELSSISQVIQHNKERVKEIKAAGERIQALVQNVSASQDLGATALEEMRKSLKSLETSTRAANAEDIILRLLAFDIMFDREEIISPAPGTLEWVTGDSHDESSPDGPSSPSRSLDATTLKNREKASAALVTWMRSGSGIFHITGRPGAGKSTLMKHISTHPRLYQDLVNWAGGKSFVFVRFFFWGRGEKLQKSLEGLHRSILFQCLQQHPAMIEKVFPEQLQAARDSPDNHYLIRLTKFRPSDIEKGFETLVAMKASENYQFCMLIDGLDEYSEDSAPDFHHMTLAGKLRAWSASGIVKFCVSSREHNAFMSAFHDSPRIKLHEMTRIDIRVFCHRLIEQSDSSIFAKDFNAAFIVEHIVNRADGVFLWADIAARAAAVSASRRDSFSSILKNLESPPGKIDRLYDTLLGSLSETERREAHAMLAVATRLKGSLSSIAYTWLHDLPNPDFPDWRAAKFPLDEIKKRREDARCRIQGYTKGLLTIGHTRAASDKTIFGYVDEVNVCHWSLQEYILRKGQQTELQSFYPDLSNDEILGRLKLAELSYVWGVEDLGHDDQTAVSWSTALLGPLDPEYHCAGQISDPVLNGLFHFANGIRFEKAFVGGSIGPFYESAPQGVELINPVPYLAAFHNQGRWIQRLTGVSNLAPYEDRMPIQSLLCSAVLGSADDAVRELLQWQPDIYRSFNSMSLRPAKAGELITVCDILAYQVMAVACNSWTVTASPVDPNATCNILEMFLAKHMEPRYVFVLEGFDNADKKWRCVATLAQAVEMIEPRNIEALRKYFTAEGQAAVDFPATCYELGDLPRLRKDQVGLKSAFVEGLFRGNVEIPHDFRAILY